MRILHCDTDDLDNPLRGGQPVRTYEINSRLTARHDIIVLTATYNGSKRNVTRGNVEYRRLGLTIPGLGLSPHLSYMAALRSAVRSTPHDLVVEEFTPPIGFALLPGCTQSPVVCIVQWFFFRDWERRYRLPFEQIMRTAAKRSGYRNFIVQSERMRQYFTDLIPAARVWKLGCGVDDSLFQRSGSDSQYAVFIGRLDLDHKGLDLMMEAWGQMHQSGLTVPLRIVGEGPGRGYLERQIADRGLADHVTLLGRLEGDQKRNVLHGCALVVMPSRHETFGIVAVEAMASSKPVVAFDIDHLNEVLRPDWAVLAGPPNATSLMQAVVRLWGDPAERQRLGDRGYQAAQSHRWDAIAREQERIYNEVTGAANGR